MARSMDSAGAEKQALGGQPSADSGAEVDLDLQNFDSLSSPDGDYTYRQDGELPSPPTSAHYQQTDDLDDRALGGFRKYDVHLGDSSDEDGASGKLSNHSEPRQHSSEGASTGTLFPSQIILKPLALDQMSSLDLCQMQPAGGIGQGGCVTLLPNQQPPRTISAADGNGTTAGQGGGIGKSISQQSVSALADPAGLPAAASGMAELDLSVPMPTLSSGHATQVDAPDGLTLHALCASGSKQWQRCTVRLCSTTIYTPPASSMLRTLGLKRSTELLRCPAKLTKKKRCFGNRMQIWSLAELPSRSPQFYLSGAGLTLQKGSIEMSAGSFWCISTTRTVLQGTCIKGGCIVIHGKGTEVILSEVTLDNCSVVVVGGAKAMLLKCKCTSAEVGLFAAGLGTTAEMRRCDLVACRQAVCVESGAQAVLQGVQCGQATITCIEARGKNTKLTMKRCIAGDSKKGRSADWDVRAVYAHSGAEVCLAECAFARATFGLWVEGASTHLEASHCKVRNNTRCSVLVAAGASVDLHHCMAVGSKEFHGVEVGDRGSHAELNSCVLQRNRRCGAVSYEGATVTANACTTEGNGAAAYRSRDGSRMCLTDCTSRNDDSGIAAFGRGAVAEATSCLVEGSRSGGIRVGAGGLAHGTGCHIRGCREGHGVDVVDTGSVVQLFKCVVAGNKKHAGIASRGGRLETYGCVEEGNGSAGFKAGAGGELKSSQTYDPPAREAVAGGDNCSDGGSSSGDNQDWGSDLREAARMAKAEADAAHAAAMASRVF